MQEILKIVLFTAFGVVVYLFISDAIEFWKELHKPENDNKNKENWP